MNDMKVKNKFRKVILALTVMAVGLVVWCPLSLKKIGDRDGGFRPDKELTAEIREETKGMTAEEIRSYGIRKTARMLSFAEKNDLAEGEANCVGYAEMCAGICNNAFQTNGLQARAKPVVGYVMCGSVNMCSVLKGCMPTGRWKAFVKDHDFVEFNIDGETVFADACAYDLLWNDIKTKEK